MEITKSRALTASVVAHTLGMARTSEQLRRMPEKLERFKEITDPERKLVQGRWLSLAADFTEKTFHEDMEELGEYLSLVRGSCESAAGGIRRRAIGLVLADISFAAMALYSAAAGALSAANAAVLVSAAALLNLSFLMSSATIKSQASLLRDGPALIEKGIKDIKSEVAALTGEK